MTYAKHLKQLAADDPQSFICHYYNYYFAHTAGGRMIGKKVSLEGVGRGRSGLTQAALLPPPPPLGPPALWGLGKGV